jgi:Cdc6-like AAA superfamily ATPase
LREQKYNSWLLSGHSGLLWLYGDPGIGKTMLATHIIERLQQRAKTEGTMIVVYHFCDHQDKQKSILCSILRGLMSQLVEADPALIKNLEQDYERVGNDMFSNFRIMVRLFVDIVNGMRPHVPYCVIDGLDECDPESIPLLLREMFAPRHSTTTTES